MSWAYCNGPVKGSWFSLAFFGEEVDLRFRKPWPDIPPFMKCIRGQRNRPNRIGSEQRPYGRYRSPGSVGVMECDRTAAVDDVFEDLFPFAYLIEVPPQPRPGNREQREQCEQAEPEPQPTPLRGFAHTLILATLALVFLASVRQLRQRSLSRWPQTTANM